MASDATGRISPPCRNVSGMPGHIQTAPPCATSVREQSGPRSRGQPRATCSMRGFRKGKEKPPANARRLGQTERNRWTVTSNYLWPFLSSFRSDVSAVSRSRFERKFSVRPSDREVVGYERPRGAYNDLKSIRDSHSFICNVFRFPHIARAGISQHESIIMLDYSAVIQCRKTTMVIIEKRRCTAGHVFSNVPELRIVYELFDSRFAYCYAAHRNPSCEEWETTS